MAFSNVVREMVIQLRFAVDSKAIKQVDSIVDNLQKKLNNMGGMEQIKTSMVGIAKTGAVMAAGFAAATAGLGFFLTEAGNFDKTRIAFETMTGDIKTGRALLGELHDFALRTPFTLQDVEQNSAMLLGMGIATEKVIPTMKMLGDVASGINRPLGMVALNFGQIKTRGVLMGTELRDFARQGVPIIQQLADDLGIAASKIQGMASDRSITFEQVERAFINMTSEGGRFADLMIKQAKTWPVMMSNFGIRLKILSRSIGQALTPAAIRYLKVLTKWIAAHQKVISDTLIKMFKIFLELVKRLAILFVNLIPSVKGLVNAFGGVEVVLKTLIGLFALAFGLQMSHLIGLMVLSIGKVTTALKLMGTAGLIAQLKIIAIPIAIGVAVLLLIAAVQDIIGFFQGKNSVFGLVIDQLSKWVKEIEVVNKVLEFLTDPLAVLQSVLDALIKVISGKSIGDWLSEGLIAFFSSDAYSKFIEFITSIAGFFRGKGGQSSLGSALLQSGQFGLAGAGSGLPGGVTAPVNRNVSNSSKTNVTIEKIDINGAGDPQAVGAAVVEQISNSLPKDIMNNADSNFATSPKGSL